MSHQIGQHQASSGPSQLQLVTFEVAGEEFAVDILAVQEINRMNERQQQAQSQDRQQSQQIAQERDQQSMGSRSLI